MAARTALATAAAVLLLSACSATTSAVTPPASPAVGTDHPADSLSPAPLPALTMPAAAAIPVAHDALLAYADHGSTAEQWFAHLAPYLSDTAQQAYYGTDPALVAVHQLNGPAELAPQTSSYLARVTFGTDDGRYAVLLSRRLADGSWQVEQFIPHAQ